MNQGKRSTTSQTEAAVGEPTHPVSNDADAERAVPASGQNENKAPQSDEPETEKMVGHDALADLQTQLEEALAKADDNWNQFLRARADLENVQRRSERDLSNAHKFGIEKFAKDLLPVKDSLEMGIAAATEDGADAAKLVEGSELTLKMLAAALGKYGIKVVDPKGEKFDPEQHEAMAMQPSKSSEPNTILQVIQKGYLLNDRVLRPAMVIVAKAD
jgi:molecular chaperone GrpE